MPSQLVLGYGPILRESAAGDSEKVRQMVCGVRGGLYNPPMIRAATADVPTIAQLIRALAEYERLSQYVQLEEGRLREHLFGPRPFAEVLLAEEAGTAVGYALFFPIYSTFLAQPGIYLEDLFVLPEHRGQGHGKALLAALARLAVQRGSVWLDWVVLNWNEPSIRFYQALGALPLSDWTGYRLTGDALLRLAAAPS
jgi:GNAT superfamily N-acetyltransferase